MLRSKTGFSEKDLNRLAGQGLLKGDKRNAYGLTLYSEATLRRLMSTDVAGEISLVRLPPIGLFGNGVNYSAEESVKVARLVRDGRSLDDIHIETGLHPTLIDVILKDLAKLKDAILIPKATMDLINRLPLEGNLPITDADELYEVLKSASKQQVCPRCRQRPRTRQCATCVRDTAPKTAATEDPADAADKAQ